MKLYKCQFFVVTLQQTKSLAWVSSHNMKTDEDKCHHDDDVHILNFHWCSQYYRGTTLYTAYTPSSQLTVKDPISFFWPPRIHFLNSDYHYLTINALLHYTFLLVFYYQSRKRRCEKNQGVSQSQIVEQYF